MQAGKANQKVPCEVHDGLAPRPGTQEYREKLSVGGRRRSRGQKLLSRAAVIPGPLARRASGPDRFRRGWRDHHHRCRLRRRSIVVSARGCPRRGPSRDRYVLPPTLVTVAVAGIHGRSWVARPGPPGWFFRAIVVGRIDRSCTRDDCPTPRRTLACLCRLCLEAAACF